MVKIGAGDDGRIGLLVVVVVTVIGFVKQQARVRTGRKSKTAALSIV